MVAAYSSQECSQCGYVDGMNRPAQDTFHCQFCGHKDSADGNASKVLVGRSDDTELKGISDYREVKTVLLKRFYDRFPDARSVSAVQDTSPQETKVVKSQSAREHYEILSARFFWAYKQRELSKTAHICAILALLAAKYIPFRRKQQPFQNLVMLTHELEEDSRLKIGREIISFEF